MTLQQVYSNASSKSYFSRSDGEVWSAINAAGVTCFNYLGKELRGFGRKVDTSTVALVAGTTTYSLPADCDQLVQVAERQNSTDPWTPMQPASGENDPSFIEAGFDVLALSDFMGEGSQFMYYGPYMDAAAEVGSQTQKIDIQPAPTGARLVRLVYVVKWTDILQAASTFPLPSDCLFAMEKLAIAELLRANDDLLSQQYEAKGYQLLTEVLSRLRMRQVQQFPPALPYLGGF